MKKFWNKKELPYIVITIILGSLSHFIYEWSGEASLAALFCPVNESVWEHLKLLFFPYLLVNTYIYYQKKPSGKYPFSRYYCSRFFAVLTGMFAIIVLFYTYTGVLGQDFIVVDIMIFIVSTVLAFLAAPFFYYKCALCKDAPSTAIIGWILFALLFFIFTCYAPDIPLFYSPT